MTITQKELDKFYQKGYMVEAIAPSTVRYAVDTANAKEGIVLNTVLAIAPVKEVTEFIISSQDGHVIEEQSYDEAGLIDYINAVVNH